VDFKINCNSHVKVKLTDFGISVLQEQHEELDKHIKERGGKGLGDFVLNIDSDGYYQTQLWILMSKFGHVMHMGFEIPFYLDIILTNGEPIIEVSDKTEIKKCKLCSVQFIPSLTATVKDKFTPA